jgi:hypothetical protein
MRTRRDLCQKSRLPVTKITPIFAFDCDSYHDRQFLQHHLGSAGKRNLAEDLGNRRIVVLAAGVGGSFWEAKSFLLEIAKKFARNFNHMPSIADTPKLGRCIPLPGRRWRTM